MRWRWVLAAVLVVSVALGVAVVIVRAWGMADEEIQRAVYRP